jgi:hypothetical protein
MNKNGIKFIQIDPFGLVDATRVDIRDMVSRIFFKAFRMINDGIRGQAIKITENRILSFMADGRQDSCLPFWVI